MTLPNLLLIITDCLRSDYLFGQKGTANTPFIDDLRRDGVAFSNMIAAMSITTPNFVSLLAGRYPIEHGIRFLSGQLNPDAGSSLVHHFKENGYHAYGLFTGPLFEDSVGLNEGFERYECRDRHAYLDSQWGDRFVQHLHSGEFEEPWFIILHLWELHQPRHTTRIGQTGTPYEKALSSLDGQLRRIWEQVEGASTLPVVGALTGDHGEWVESGILDETWRKGLARLRKLTMRAKPKANWHGYHLYDYLVRVPLVVFGKPVPQVGSIGRQIRQIDLLPTLADALGIPVPGSITGRSVWPLALGADVEELPAFLEASGGPSLLETPSWLFGVRHQGWKYAYRPGMPGKDELYDLQTDPDERRNLFAQYPEKAQRYRRLIETQYLPLAPTSSAVELDLRETEQRLRDLGYL